MQLSGKSPILGSGDDAINDNDEPMELIATKLNWIGRRRRWKVFGMMWCRVALVWCQSHAPDPTSYGTVTVTLEPPIAIRLQDLRQLLPKNPQWASISYGAVMCHDCSGKHDVKRVVRFAQLGGLKIYYNNNTRHVS